MSLVALQPSANAAARRHFEDTIERAVPVESAARFLPKAVVADLRLAHPNGEMRVWGAKPGERFQQVTKWNRLRPGDYIAFAADGRLFAGAVITRVFRSPSFARELWGETSTANGTAQTWELMFSVSDIEELDVSYSVMNPLIGRAPRANVQEFAVLSEVASAALLEYLNRTENSYEELDSPLIRQALITSQLDETDRAVTAMRRMEQRAIKTSLLQGSTVAVCDLCGQMMGAEFLTAAHIKRRSICSDAERVMLSAVAMLNCRFGCDELFGKGYVGVDSSGTVRVSDVLAPGPARTYAEAKLVGRTCSAWEDRVETREFFAYHWSYDFRRPVVLSRD